MKFRSKNNTLSKSILISYFLIFILVFLSIGIITITSFLNSKKALSELGENALRNRIQMALTFMDTLETEVSTGHLSRQKAQEIFKSKMLNQKESDGKTRGLNSKLELNIKAYMYAIDSTGLEQMHPFKEGENISNVIDTKGQNVTQLIFSEGKNPKNNGIIHFSWKNPGDNIEKPKVNAVAYFEPWDWYINVGCYNEDFYMPAYKILHSILLISIIILLITLCLVWRMVTKKINPLNQIIDLIEKMGAGDLTSKLNIHSKDEMGYISSILNNTIDEISSIMVKIKETATTLTEKMNNINSSTALTMESSNNIKDAMDEISSGIMDTTRDMQESFNSVTELTEDISSIKESSLFLEDQIQKANSLNINIIKVLDDLAIKNDENINTIKDTTDNMEVLINKSDTIVSITSTITNISSQINLLALNASIESARAGEAGRGFAVVSQEIKQLAEQTSNAAGQIGDLITELICAVNASVESFKKNTKSAEEQHESISETQNTLKTVIDFIEDMPNLIEKSMQKIEHAHSKKDTITSSMDSVLAVTEQISASTEEISASIAQVNENIIFIHGLSDELTSCTQDLNEGANKFKLL